MSADPSPVGMKPAAYQRELMRETYHRYKPGRHGLCTHCAAGAVWWAHWPPPAGNRQGAA